MAPTTPRPTAGSTRGWEPDRAVGSTVGWTLAAGVLLAVIAFGIYLATQTDRFYDHFVWQASAFLEGQAAIRYPVGGDGRKRRECILSRRPAGGLE